MKIELRGMKILLWVNPRNWKFLILFETATKIRETFSDYITILEYGGTSMKYPRIKREEDFWKVKSALLAALY